MNQTFDILLKYTKRNTRLNIINALTFISIFFVIAIPFVFCSTPEGELQIGKFIAITCVIMFFYFGIAYKLIFYLEEKNLRDMIAAEKENGTVIMFNPYLTTRKRDLLHEVLGDSCKTTRDKKYFLFFHPYKGDCTTTVKYQISEELYLKYKERIENYRTPFEGMVPVTIDSNTGLFDNKFEYTTKNLDWDFLEYC